MIQESAINSLKKKPSKTQTVDMGLMEEAILIRRVEETFLELFSQGKMNGTVHTCVGQEFSAIAFAGQLDKNDFIFSNHRCHGHYISFTKDYKGLIAELMGKEIGTCGGVGSSQHLCKDRFYSNGVQGGIVPVAAGMALANKLNNKNDIGIVFVGDGTLGEGVLYETMNIVSKWEIPLLIVLENNCYAQSTPQCVSQAGNILARAQAFGIETSESNTWDTEQIIVDALESINKVRKTVRPLFHLVHTYRLNPHSKGDDNRDTEEIQFYRKKDPIEIFKNENADRYTQIVDKINREIEGFLKEIESENELPIERYFQSPAESQPSGWVEIEEINIRQVDLLNRFFDEYLSKHRNMVFMGEDVASPYGGAFKVSKNLSDRYPDRVLSTPISEAAITGIANGLALSGIKPYVEIMFGDFVTLTLDQVINHASKFHHMYNLQANCPIVLRTPMGGGRGYGPTHSQTLDRFLIGIDNVATIAINTLVDPGSIYREIHEEEHPVIVIENKLDYGRKIGKKRMINYRHERSDARYPVIRLRPMISKPNATIATYGGMVDLIMECLPDLFSELDIKAEVIVMTKIHPLDLKEIVISVSETRRLYTVEEGNVFSGWGAEVIAQVTESVGIITARRIGKLPVPIASSRDLESSIIPNKERIIRTIRESL